MHAFFATLKSEHSDVKKILKSLENTTSRAQSSRLKLLEKLRENIIPHSRAEELAFYKPMKKEGEHKAEVIGIEGHVEHRLVDQMLEELDNCEPSTAAWDAKFSVLKELVLHHIKEEESTFFKEAQQVFDKDELTNMFENYMSLKERFMDDLPSQQDVLDQQPMRRQRQQPRYYERMR